MKICNLLLCLNKGGAENVATILSNEWSKKNHDISLVLLTDRKKWPFAYQLNKNIKVRDYSVNENINRNRYTGYNSETNGKSGDFIYESPSVKVINYDKGLNYNKNRLIQSVTVEEKDIGGYYIQQQDIPIVEHKSVSRKIKGIL